MTDLINNPEEIPEGLRLAIDRFNTYGLKPPNCHLLVQFFHVYRTLEDIRERLEILRCRSKLSYFLDKSEHQDQLRRCGVRLDEAQRDFKASATT